MLLVLTNAFSGLLHILLLLCFLLLSKVAAFVIVALLRQLLYLCTHFVSLLGRGNFLLLKLTFHLSILPQNVRIRLMNRWLRQWSCLNLSSIEVASCEISSHDQRVETTTILHLLSLLRFLFVLVYHILQIIGSSFSHGRLRILVVVR